MEKSKNSIVARRVFKTAKILAWITVAFIVFLLVISSIVYFSRDRIKQYLIDEINKQLLTEISVKNIDFTVFTSFPYVSLIFFDVIIPETINGVQGEDVLIRARSVSLQFNIFDILRKRYHLKRVNIDTGECNLKILNDGSENYMFWKTDTTDQETSDFKLLLQKVSMKDIEIQYVNFQNNIEIGLHADKFSMNGYFHRKDFEMAFSGDLHSHRLIVGENRLLEDIPLKCSGKMNAETENNIYTFRDCVIHFSGVKLFMSGVYAQSEVPYADFAVANEKSGLSDLEQLLPEEFRKKLEPFDKKGTVRLSAVIRGPLTASAMPAFKLEAKLEKGRMIRPETKIVLEDLSFQFIYECKDLLFPSESQLHCSNFSAKLETGKLQGSFKINGFSTSEIELSLDADMELRDIQNLMKFEEIENMSGRIAGKISFRGRFNDLSNIQASDFLNADSDGTVTSDKIDLKLKNFTENIYLQSLYGVFSQKDFRIETLTVSACGSDVSIKGTAFNIFPFLFVEKQKIDIRGEARSKTIYVDRLFAANRPSTTNAPAKAYVDFSENIRLDLDIHVNELFYDTFTANDVRANLILNNKLLLLRDMKFKSMDGTVNAEVIVDARPLGNIDFRVMANLNQVNIEKTFKDLHNFGQNSLTNEHLKGTLKGTVHLSSVWTKDLVIDWNSLTVVADLEVKNGSIQNYEPLSGLRKYFRRRDFSKVEFATLTNQIFIRDKEIVIPQMSIKSSVMDFEMLGTHYFDNRINYNLKIQFAELVRKNERPARQSAEDSYGLIQDENDNILTWHFKVTGTVDDPKFVPLDLQSVSSKVKQDLKKESKTAVNILQREFTVKKDSTQTIPEHKEGEQKKLLIQWDDE
jgi:hypothetical protein